MTGAHRLNACICLHHVTWGASVGEPVAAGPGSLKPSRHIALRAVTTQAMSGNRHVNDPMCGWRCAGRRCLHQEHAGHQRKERDKGTTLRAKRSPSTFPRRMPRMSMG